MKENFSLIIVAFLALVLASSIWNLLIMCKIKKSIKSKSSINANEFYFELKSRIQLITTIFSIVVVILTYYGFTTEDRIQQRIDNQVSEEFGKYDKRFASTDSSMSAIELFIKNLDVQKEAISSTLLNAGQGAKEIEKNINILASKKLSNLNFYIVPGFKVDDDSGIIRCNYKDMLTSEGKKLPKFTKAPYLNIGVNSSTFNATMITNNIEYFEIKICSICDYKGDFLIDIWLASYN